MTPMHSHNLLRPIAVIAASFSVMGSALADTFGDFTYTSNGTEVTITGHANVSMATLVIPAEINGVPVRTISSLYMGTPTNNLGNSVTSVTIPEGVTTIGSSVFKDFFALTSVTIPNSVTAMGNHVFLNCTALTSATFGNGLTALDGAFHGCSSLTSVDLPDNLVSMAGTFTNCTSLTQVQIPASVTTINLAFKGCTGLTSVVLPDGMTTVGQAAFQGCTSLQSVTFPSGLVTIGPDAFAGCSSLASFNLPSSLKTIDYAAFFDCTSLASLSLPSGLTSIRENAFDGCISLTSLTVPESVTYIGDSAFWRCPALTEINLPAKFLSSLSSIGLDYKPEVASNALVSGIANSLANSPSFVSKLADTIIAKNDHYGLATQTNISTLANEIPQVVTDMLDEANAAAPVAHGITSDLGVLVVKKGRSVNYTVTTTFAATAFAAIGLPDGLGIDPTTGVISGKTKKAGNYNVFFHAGVSGGGSVSGVKTINVTP